MSAQKVIWTPGIAPITVIMITLNEGHNMRKVFENLLGWAYEIYVVDSFSDDKTVDICLEYGAKVVQRRFRNFGDQWNFALDHLNVQTPWTMKLDPDERITEILKENLIKACQADMADAFSVRRRLWLMNKPLPVKQSLIRVWRTNKCTFTKVAVNEHPIIHGHVVGVRGDIEHHDSPSLEHWLCKQNRYTSAEALIRYRKSALAEDPRIFGNPLQRRMWLKKNFHKIPFRFLLFFLYHYLIIGGFRAGKVGFIWAHLRTQVMMMVEFKYFEIHANQCEPIKYTYTLGSPDNRVQQYE